MELATIDMDRHEARKAFLDYRRAVRARHSQEDAEIMRGYRALANGHQLIHLSETIRAGGSAELSYRSSRWSYEHRRSVPCTTTNLVPRLGVVRADAKECFTAGVERDGTVCFQSRLKLSERNVRERVLLRQVFGPQPEGEYPNRLHEWSDAAWRAICPIVPPPLRPAHALSNYAILFEAEWSRATPPAPVDPALLKHIGGDIYAVLAIWNLTELERAVLSGRAGN